MGSQIWVFSLIYVLVILNFKFHIVGAYEEDQTRVHIIYLGEKQHNDPEVVTASHFKMLEDLLGSKKEARESMIHSYRYGFSGFAAYLTDSQAATISEHPDVVEVSLNRYYQVQTTRTYDYLGLSRTTFPQHGLLLDANMGDDVIIGVFDTGVWPESQSFNDSGLGPIPTRWKGKCVDGDKFDSTKHCNRKLIGARYYMESLFPKNNKTDIISGEEYMSARENYPHGTHVASTAGGSFVSNASFQGFGLGTVRGGAPSARIAVYKVCWRTVHGNDNCGSADLLKAMDNAIEDGVDVMSISLGRGIPIQTETDSRNDQSYGAFHAMLKGIPVIISGGNDGPVAYTVTNIAPWMITVAATTLDRRFPTPLTLGNNNVTLLAQAPYKGQDIKADLVFVETADKITSGANGKVVFTFVTHDEDAKIADLAKKQIDFGVKAMIVSTKADDFFVLQTDYNPFISINYEQGTVMMKYIDSTSTPTIKIGESITLVGPLVATKVAQFSSRGPNSVSPYVLKPDISAPGVAILAASTPLKEGSENGFAIESGTSMSAPVVAGVVALLRAVHRDWSPAAIRSALVTTASTTDPNGEPIFANGLSQKLADPFDMGAGLVNPNKAADPGLVYDAGVEDYLRFLCASGYNEASISKIANKGVTCPTPKPSMLDLNLPSITVPFLNEDVVTVTRTVTNVGPVNSIYKLVVVPPRGVRINVTPSILIFNSFVKQLSFEVTISTTHRANSIYYFGSLTWTDCDHNVTIPLSVRTQMVMYFD